MGYCIKLNNLSILTMNNPSIKDVKKVIIEECKKNMDEVNKKAADVILTKDNAKEIEEYMFTDPKTGKPFRAYGEMRSLYGLKKTKFKKP